MLVERRFADPVQRHMDAGRPNLPRDGRRHSEQFTGRPGGEVKDLFGGTTDSEHILRRSSDCHNKTRKH